MLLLILIKKKCLHSLMLALVYPIFNNPNENIGGLTGAIEISITFPTEYTKTVMQLYPEMNKKGTIATMK